MLCVSEKLPASAVVGFGIEPVGTFPLRVQRFRTVIDTFVYPFFDEVGFIEGSDRAFGVSVRWHLKAGVVEGPSLHEQVDTQLTQHCDSHNSGDSR